MAAPNLTLALVALTPLVGCSPSRPLELRTLRSGEQIAIPSVTETNTENGYRTLHVDYASGIPVDDYVALVPQVEDVWASFLTEAEREHHDAAMISAHAGDAAEDKTTFPIVREDDGEWHVPYILDLKTGGSVVVVSEHVDRDALFVDYATALAVRPQDLCVLAPEVDAVWAEFRAKAEAARVQKAFISPNDKPILGTLIAFAFRRSAEGQWSRVTATHCDTASPEGENQDRS